MKKVRVLVVDDSVVIRQLLGGILEEHPEIEVVGRAANGVIALQKIALLTPDLVTLDVEMPEMDGIETLKRIRAACPDLPVIMFSSQGEQSARATVEALAIGASDFISKPANFNAAESAIQQVRDQLIPRVMLFGKPRDRVKAASEVYSTAARPISEHQNLTKVSSAAVEVVALGVSTGGPDALNRLIPLFPVDLSVPLFVVQHMPPIFTRQLAQRLNSNSQIEVVEGADGMPVRSGCVYIAPGGFHMGVHREKSGMRIRLAETPPEHSCRPAVDYLFRSIAENYGSRSLAVVLTGMGHDGTSGAAVLKACGALVFAQDEQSSVVWGMPGSVVKAGLADKVVSLQAMRDEILAVSGYAF
ncbi:MAG: chemotaxis response regulator protein-glutamate methylesterase [bacterium]|nr:chemotaxis response regulator protein-glutamate methylesterase [bacterium]